MVTARSIRTRLDRIAHAAVASHTAVNTVENWTERFLTASPSHREVMDQITERARIHTRGFIDRDTGRMHAGHAITSMLHQVPELLEPCAYRFWRTVEDAEVARPLMQRFIALLAGYQRSTGDFCPGLWGIRELAAHPTQRSTVVAPSPLQPCRSPKNFLAPEPCHPGDLVHVDS